MAEIPRVYLTRRLPQPAMERLSQEARVSFWPGELPPPRPVLIKESAEADGLLVLPTDRVDREVLAAGRRLRAVGTYDDECDNVDLVAATDGGILVVHGPALHAEATADFTFALLLTAARRVLEADRFVRGGRWRSWGPETLLGRELQGATLGVVGLGKVGRAVARRAEAFGMRVIYATASEHPAMDADGLEHAPLARLLGESDVVTLHCPLTDETYQLIDRDALALMKPDALLINTAHGLLVDTQALVAALRARPMTAALDVTAPEPLPADHPLLGLPNAIVTPHIAGAGRQGRLHMALAVVEGLLAALRGERPEHLANPMAWRERAAVIGGADVEQ